MSVVIIDYGAGNLHSAYKAFERMAAPLHLPVTLSAHAEDVARASHIVLPGVGAFGDCIRALRAVPDMVETLNHRVIHRHTPFLGICVGMQMMCERGLEHGEHQGLGWIKGSVVPITPSSPPAAALRIPHMGWNALTISASDHPIFRQIHSGDHAYFVHSYHARCERSADQQATVEYGAPLSACIGHDTMIGTQFHPEKSQQVGLQLISNFLQIASRA